ncbi:hypothetical protein KC853_02585 [Candidatus Saccharibacteria bacterium]|nr:hypothetical protein [Candidatus Saccharibacteria bacterium]MCB9834974.1 hypothetical protein [Candidatus Nomurabacteria bacterium]
MITILLTGHQSFKDAMASIFAGNSDQITDPDDIVELFGNYLLEIDANIFSDPVIVGQVETLKELDLSIDRDFSGDFTRFWEEHIVPVAIGGVYTVSAIILLADEMLKSYKPIIKPEIFWRDVSSFAVDWSRLENRLDPDLAFALSVKGHCPKHTQGYINTCKDCFVLARIDIETSGFPFNKIRFDQKFFFASERIPYFGVLPNEDADLEYRTYGIEGNRIMIPTSQTCFINRDGEDIRDIHFGCPIYGNNVRAIFNTLRELYLKRGIIST